MKSKILIGFIISSIILKLLISAMTWHPDYRPFQYAGMIINQGHFLDLYDYALKDPDPRIKIIVNLNYPPLIYWYYGLWQGILVNGLQLSLFDDYLIESASDFGNFWFSLHLLLIKFPLLPIDLLGGWLFAKLFNDRKQQLWAWGLWLFNPLNLFATYMMGQFDLIPVVGMIGALYLVKRNRWNWAAISLGVGIAFKLFPLFLIVPFVLMKQSWRQRIILFILTLAPYVLSILPYIGSSGYRATAMVAEQSMKSLYAGIALSGGEKILLYPWLLAIVYGWWYYSKPIIEKLWSRWLVVLLLFLSLTHYHPQWLLWLAPLVMIDLIQTKGRYLMLVLAALVCWLGQLILFDQSLSLGLWAPIFPNAYYGLDIWQLLNIKVDQGLWRSLWQSGFAAISVLFIWRLMSEKADEN